MQNDFANLKYPIFQVKTECHARVNAMTGFKHISRIYKKPAIGRLLYNVFSVLNVQNEYGVCGGEVGHDKL